MSLNNRREIIFLYDVVRSNPNGDPDDGNRPRMDEEGYNIVSDVRLKRTIRDYWLSRDDGKNILIKRVFKKDGNVMSMADMVIDEMGYSGEGDAKREELLKKLPETFLDVRTFGAAVTLKGANVSITGPVQFGIGISLNKPEVETIAITSVLSSTGEQGAGSMGTTHFVDYSLINFHGIVCETNSKELNFTEEDLNDVYKGLWLGTKNLNTRSKFNHNPHLILSVVSKEKEFQIGNLDTYLKLKEEVGLKATKDAVVNVDLLIQQLESHKNEINSIELLESGALTFELSGKTSNSLKEFLEPIGIKIETISF